MINALGLVVDIVSVPDAVADRTAGTSLVRLFVRLHAESWPGVA